MTTFTQANRPMAFSTPVLKPDTLLLTGLTGQEGLSQLFTFQLGLAAVNQTDVPFDKLLGQPATVRLDLPGGKRRFLNGICSRVAQGGSDAVFTSYHLEVVPKFWLLNKRSQSRVFQHLSVPDILKKVLTGLDVGFELQGSFLPRDYCVQYRETDFNFACRLMEEEGIYYYFKHADGSHQLVLANTPSGHADLPEVSRVLFDSVSGGNRPEDRVVSWIKRQEVRAGKFNLFDHCFEIPHKHLEAHKVIQDSVRAGQVEHRLKLAVNADLELFDFPGEYAQRFDGVDKGGGDRPADLQHIFADNQRTVAIRMQQEAVPAVVIQGIGRCRQMASGHKFTLATLPDDAAGRLLKADGPYVLTSVAHFARQADYRSNSAEFQYQNNFTCIPLGLPFRPPRNTPKPFVQGSQTAVVVGPPGEEIFTDKYGRVKVQFHWDREGQNDLDSSCWVRVGTIWAGKQWGAIHIPRVGQEVLVDFLEGDPDQPIIVGSVYNAEMMPPYKLPDKKTQSGLKSRSTLKGTAENFNELRFEDKKGHEDVYFHAEKDFHRVVENDDDLKVGNDQTITVHNNRTEKVEKGDEKVTVAKGHRTILVETGNDLHQIKKGNREVQIDMGNDTLTIKMGNQTTKLDLGKSETEAMQSIELKVGQSSVKLDQTGVTIKGMVIKVEGQIQTEVKGLMTQVSGDALTQIKGGITMIG
jgi:type VI secretion system secreted protein VgrG